jgi:hypothetical protein
MHMYQSLHGLNKIKQFNLEYSIRFMIFAGKQYLNSSNYVCSKLSSPKYSVW